MPLRNIYIIIATIALSLFFLSKTSLRLQVLHYVLKKIEQESLDSVDRQQLLEAAIDGMTQSISDYPYTSYLPIAQTGEYERELQGQIAGIGLFHLQKVHNGDFSFVPIAGTPADKAGLKWGERIVAVDRQCVKDWSLSQLIENLRGTEGTQVTLTIAPPDSDESYPITVTRQVFQQEVVFGDHRLDTGKWDYQLENRPAIGYIGVSQFTDSMIHDFTTATTVLRNKGVDKLIVDFRGNPGGFLPSAVQLCDLFIGADKEIVTTRYRSGKVKKIFYGTDRLKETFDMVILIDEESASASEIVAACLQDHGRATIIGSRSYGKGTIQELFPLPAQMGMLRLTDAGFWRPSNEPLHRFPHSTDGDSWGVKPDDGFEVPVSPKNRAITQYLRDLRRSLRLEDCKKATAGFINEIKKTTSEEPPGDLQTEIPERFGLLGSAEDMNEPDLTGNAPWYDPQLDRAVEFLLMNNENPQ